MPAGEKVVLQVRGDALAGVVSMMRVGIVLVRWHVREETGVDQTGFGGFGVTGICR